MCILKKDADKDGVSDRLDKCPNTPANVAVDNAGCPIDTDKDGVADYLDACPDIPGIVELKGCPDKDGDGTADKDDRCPDVAGPLSLKGCPDTDGDGVADIDDLCPAIKGTIANKGCPEIAKEDLVKITNIASKIFFETNKDILKTESLAQLDELVEILKKYERANLLIEGHADSQGPDEYNLALSQRRTEAVKKYLMSKGIMESRLTAIGYGETRPIADNNTAAGRAKNRRVELKTSY